MTRDNTLKNAFPSPYGGGSVNQQPTLCCHPTAKCISHSTLRLNNELPPKHSVQYAIQFYTCSLPLASSSACFCPAAIICISTSLLGPIRTVGTNTAAAAGSAKTSAITGKRGILTLNICGGKQELSPKMAERTLCLYAMCVIENHEYIIAHL